MKDGFWCISDPGEPGGVLVCIKCGQPVDEDTQYNEAEECSECGYQCHACGLFTWKARVRVSD